mgnify:CR=1 FL=1
MQRRYFLKGTGIVASTVVLVPSAIFAADAAMESIVKHSNEFIDYTAETANKLTDYALGGLIPSLAATTNTTISVVFAPLALMDEKAACPGVSMNVILPFVVSTS